MNAGIGGGISAVFSFDDAGVITESCFKFCISLLAQFISIAEKKRRFWKLASLPQTPEQIGGNDSFA